MAILNAYTNGTAGLRNRLHMKEAGIPHEKLRLNNLDVRSAGYCAFQCNVRTST